MLLATTQVEDFDRFLDIFSTKGAEKRKQHGSKGATIFRDPSEEDRVWVIFDWDEQGWQSFVSDPEVPPIMKEAGHKSKPQAAQFAVTATRNTSIGEGRRHIRVVAAPTRGDPRAVSCRGVRPRGSTARERIDRAPGSVARGRER